MKKQHYATGNGTLEVIKAFALPPAACTATLKFTAGEGITLEPGEFQHIVKCGLDEAYRNSIEIDSYGPDEATLIQTSYFPREQNPSDSKFLLNEGLTKVIAYIQFRLGHQIHHIQVDDQGIKDNLIPQLGLCDDEVQIYFSTMTNRQEADPERPTRIMAVINQFMPELVQQFENDRAIGALHVQRVQGAIQLKVPSLTAPAANRVYASLLSSLDKLSALGIQVRGDFVETALMQKRVDLPALLDFVDTTLRQAKSPESVIEAIKENIMKAHGFGKDGESRQV